MRPLHYVRDNWIALVFIIAVVASFVVNRQESLDRDRKSVAAQVQGCVSNSARTAVGAQGWLRLSDRVRERGNPGDSRSADTYAATAGGMIAEIVAPKGYEGSPTLVEVVEVKNDYGKLIIRPTARAKDLHRLGCEDRYKL